MPSSSYVLERRATPRHQIAVPVKFRPWKSALPEHAAESIDVSEGGICFTTPAPLAEGETLELRFDMPEEVVDEPVTEWRCTGQIVKVHPVAGAHFCFPVRVRFDCYEVARPNGTTTIRLHVSSL